MSIYLKLGKRKTHRVVVIVIHMGYDSLFGSCILGCLVTHLDGRVLQFTECLETIGAV